MHWFSIITMENYKTCPRCGQEKIPFKLGVCICGNQVGSIQYVKDSQEFAFNHDSFLGIRSIRWHLEWNLSVEGTTTMCIGLV